MFTLNPRDHRPIYTQIKEQFVRLITTGILPAGEKLPSVRQLATQLSINPNTIQRAYAELESEGYCYSQPGRGSFVAQASDWDDTHRKEIIHQLRIAAGELRQLGMTTQEITDLIAD